MLQLKTKWSNIVLSKVTHQESNAFLQSHRKSFRYPPGAAPSFGTKTSRGPHTSQWPILNRNGTVQRQIHPTGAEVLGPAAGRPRILWWAHKLLRSQQTSKESMSEQ